MTLPVCPVCGNEAEVLWPDRPKGTPGRKLVCAQCPHEEPDLAARLLVEKLANDLNKPETDEGGGSHG